MKPYLQYGWQPQVMAVRGRPQGDPLGGDRGLRRRGRPGGIAGPRRQRRDRRASSAGRSRDYPAGRDRTAATGRRRRTRRTGNAWRASATSPRQGGRPVREDAPSPRDMTHLFADLDRGSGLFVRERYDEAIPVFERVLEQDPQNLMVCLRLAVAHSVLGREARRSSSSSGRVRSTPTRSTSGTTWRCTTCGDRQLGRRRAALRERPGRACPAGCRPSRAWPASATSEGRVDEAIAAPGADRRPRRRRRPTPGAARRPADGRRRHGRRHPGLRGGRGTPGDALPPPPRARRPLPGGPPSRGGPRQPRPGAAGRTRAIRWRSSSAPR